MLKGLGGLAVAAAGGIGAAAAGQNRFSNAEERHKKTPERQWAFVIDLRRCDGCKYCTEACQKAHYLPPDHEWIKVYEVEDEQRHRYFMPRLCMQCEHAPCLKVCPVAATYKNPEGTILVDQDRCIGCRLCMAACPYNARYFNYESPPRPPSPFANPMPEFPVPQQKGTVGKCIFCVHFTESGKLPACVEECYMDALYIADLNSDVMTNRSGETYRLSKYLADNDAFRYKEELNTSPRVWYITGHGQHLGNVRHT